MPRTAARSFAHLLWAWLAIAGSAAAAVSEVVVDLPSRGVVQRILYLRPANPVANLVVLPGGYGVLKLRPDGTGETFLLETSAPSRERQRFAAQGFAVAVVDAPSDRQDELGLDGYRQSGIHLADIHEVVRYMRAQADAPVWLVGHSAGAESAFFVARELPPDEPVGAVLTAAAASTLRNMDPRSFSRPVLMVSHTQDPCINLADLNRLFDELLAAPVREHATLTGGERGGTGCTSGYHQFEGLGAEYVAAIADFVKRHNALVAPPAATADAIEYFHAGLDHYFLTWVGAEIAALDSGATSGWSRTGQSFKVFTTAPAGASAVCRIYIPPGLGDGHFFGRDASECDGTMQKNPSFVLESSAFFHLYPPSTGVCAAGQVPVYRAFSNRADANHRYTTDRATRDRMVASGWLAEGDGPDLVVMCAPGP
ncbi:MAG: hypothetical protein U1F58_02785 [Burkholderiales bacterium]